MSHYIHMFNIQLQTQYSKIFLFNMQLIVSIFFNFKLFLKIRLLIISYFI